MELSHVRKASHRKKNGPEHKIKAPLGTIVGIMVLALYGCASTQGTVIPPLNTPVVLSAETAASYPEQQFAAPTPVPTKTELESKSGYSIAAFHYDENHTVLIDTAGEPHFFTGGTEDYRQNCKSYEIETVNETTPVTLQPIVIADSGVSIHMNMYEVGESPTSSVEAAQIGFSAASDFYKKELERALSNFNPTGQPQEMVDAYNEITTAGIDGYFASLYQKFDESNTVFVWKELIEGYEGKPYFLIVPPSDPALHLPPADPLQIQQIITQRTGISNITQPAIDLIALTQPIHNQELGPESIMNYTGAAYSIFEPATGQFGIGISSGKTHWFNPAIPELQTPDIALQSAFVNEFGNIIPQTMPPAAQAFIYTQILNDFGVNPNVFQQPQTPRLLNEIASTAAMLNFQYSLIK